MQGFCCINTGKLCSVRLSEWLGLNDTEVRMNMDMKQVARRGLRVMHFCGLISFGVLIWMTGLAVLEVPVGLPPWRHAVGAALLATAVFVWSR